METQVFAPLGPPLLYTTSIMVPVGHGKYLQRPARLSRPYFNLEIQLYTALLELSGTQLGSKPTIIQLPTLLALIRSNARVARFQLGSRLKMCILKHLVVADQNQILNFNPAQSVFSLTYYGIYILQKHLQTVLSSDISRRAQVFGVTSAIRARLPLLNLRPALGPIGIKTLRTDILKYLDKEEYIQLTNLQSLVNAELSNTLPIHSNNQRLRKISWDYDRAADQIRCCESEIFLAVASQQPYHEVQARLDALENKQGDLEREHEDLMLGLQRMHAANTAYRDKAQHARGTADIIRLAAKQFAHHGWL
ncbi:hypothetical protein B0H10DRAFT_2038764 [Mycena sp. CBHHK59/15]|nr:hypothetical protein B0H10DRAFT_2038764 [Mycena sp. CBHHK59/15]